MCGQFSYPESEARDSGNINNMKIFTLLWGACIGLCIVLGISNGIHVPWLSIRLLVVITLLTPSLTIALAIRAAMKRNVTSLEKRLALGAWIMSMSCVVYFLANFSTSWNEVYLIMNGRSDMSHRIYIAIWVQCALFGVIQLVTFFMGYVLGECSRGAERGCVFISLGMHPLALANLFIVPAMTIFFLLKLLGNKDISALEAWLISIAWSSILCTLALLIFMMLTRWRMRFGESVEIWWFERGGLGYLLQWVCQTNCVSDPMSLLLDLPYLLVGTTDNAKILQCSYSWPGHRRLD